MWLFLISFSAGCEKQGYPLLKDGSCQKSVFGTCLESARWAGAAANLYQTFHFGARSLEETDLPLLLGVQVVVLVVLVVIRIVYCQLRLVCQLHSFVGKKNLAMITQALVTSMFNYSMWGCL